jgi:hypothetical protein
MQHAKSALRSQPGATDGGYAHLNALDIAQCLDVLCHLAPQDLRTIPAHVLVQGLALVPCPTGPGQRDVLQTLDDAFFAALTTEQARAIEAHGSSSTVRLREETPIRKRLATRLPARSNAMEHLSAAEVVHFLAHIADQTPAALNNFFDLYGARISPDVRNRIQSTRSLMLWARTTTRPLPLDRE